MEIKEETITKITLSGLDRLDPIHIMLDDIEPRKGKISIECYGKAWSSYWGGMGDMAIDEFFCSCDNGYLIGNLDSDLQSTILDEDGLSSDAQKRVISMRKDGTLDKEEARSLYNECGHIECVEENNEILHQVYGDEWWNCLPEVTNPGYSYLSRIVDAVKEGLLERRSR